MIAKGADKLKAYVGSTGVSKMYLGGALVYSKGNDNPYDEYGYVANGKVFHLDGIDKGNTANAWTDLIGGLVFSNIGSVSATSMTNSWYFSGNGNINMKYTGSLPANEDYTVEACFLNENESACLFASNASQINRPVFYFDKTYKLLFLQYRNTYNIIPEVSSAHCISLNLNVGVHNGELAPQSSATYWASDNNSYVGRRSRGNPFKGYIYSIRIYDRRLSEAEILNNQRVDNARFNLGLSL